MGRGNRPHKQYWEEGETDRAKIIGGREHDHSESSRGEGEQTAQELMGVGGNGPRKRFWGEGNGTRTTDLAKNWLGRGNRPRKSIGGRGQQRIAQKPIPARTRMVEVSNKQANNNLTSKQTDKQTIQQVSK